MTAMPLPNDVTPKGLILLSQLEHFHIAPQEMVRCLPISHRSLHHPVADLDMAEVARQALQTGDWSAAQRALQDRFRSVLLPFLEKYPHYPIVYFGSSPIPLTVLLGFQISTGHPVTVVPHHHTQRTWGWGPSAPPSPARLQPLRFPADRDRTPGEAILRVSTSHLVDAQATRKVIPEPLLELDIALEHPLEDAFTREEEMQAVAQAFRKALDLIGDQFQGIHRVHLFASVQPGMALLLGAQISKTMHPPVQTYQYARHNESGIHHLPAILVNGPSRPDPIPLTQEEADQAAQARHHLKADLQRMKGLANRWKTASSSWLAGLLQKPKGPPDFSSHWKHLPTLYSTPLLKTEVDVETRTVEDSFRLAPPHQLWQLDDHWLTQVARRLPRSAQRQQALRLLVLHELAHRGPQMLTRNSSQQVGRFAKVLEEIDYQADVWAMLHEYELSNLQAPIKASDTPRFFMELVSTATETMWAFDDGGPALTEIQVRRLNRYLIWSWQYLLLERLAGQGPEGTLEDVLPILAQRPFLELAGPHLFTRDERTYLSLETKSMRQPELAVYHEGGLYRHGPRLDFPINDLLDGVRERDSSKIRESLRGAFEQTLR